LIASLSREPVRDLDYEYDGYGNLNYQQTIVNGNTSTEGFFYDPLQRLTLSSRSYPGGSDTVSYGYDATGNLTLKDDYAQSYTYNSNRPNAVAAITKVASLGGGTVSFLYDANGNLTQGDGKSLTYTAFNKPETITAGGITATFDYGADLSRYKQEKSNGETILYLDKLMEIVTVGGTSDYRHYLGQEAILTKVGDINDPYPVVNFTLRDRLGSVVTITDEAGAVQETRGYDPFGKPRDGDWAEKVPPVIGSVTTDRGFTDHEHLDESRLIHMNGRAYDYQLGRFLSVDPVIQAPGNSQSLNPYSYIMNNPLAGTDPSGYCAVSRIQTVCDNTPALWGGTAPNSTSHSPTGSGSGMTAPAAGNGADHGVTGTDDVSNGGAGANLPADEIKSRPTPPGVMGSDVKRELLGDYSSQDYLSEQRAAGKSAAQFLESAAEEAGWTLVPVTIPFAGRFKNLLKRVFTGKSQWRGTELVNGKLVVTNVGELGEHIGEDVLRGNGWTNIRTIKNSADNGIDIVARGPNGQLGFFEVKASSTGFISDLTPRQSNMNTFLEDVLSQAAGGRGRYSSISPTDQSLARELYREFTMNPGNISGNVIGVDLTNGNIMMSSWPR